MSDFEGAFAVRIGGDSQYPARRRLTPSSLIRSTRAGERLMKAAGSYSSRLVEARLVYDGNVDQLKRGP